MVILLSDGEEVACWPLTGAGHPDLAVVDALARLQLALGRLGYSIRLRDPCPELAELLEFVGLDGPLGCGSTGATAIPRCPHQSRTGPDTGERAEPV